MEEKKLNIDQIQDLINRFNEKIDHDSQNLSESDLLYRYYQLYSGFSESINFSIIAGEYHLSKISDILSSVRNNIAKIDAKVLQLSIGKDDESIGKIKELGTNMRYFLECYNKLVSNTKIHSDYRQKGLYINATLSEIIDFNRLINDLQDIVTDSSSNKKFDFYLFQLNVKMAEIDDRLICDKSILRDLVKAKKELTEKLVSLPIAEILLEKCRFFIYKIARRLKEKYVYVIDDQYEGGKNILEDKEIIDENAYKYFGQFHGYVNQQYNIDNFRFETSVSIALTKKLENKKLENLREIHYLSKFILLHSKEKNCDYKFYFNLLLAELNKFKNADESIGMNFNEYAYFQAEILLLNSELKCDVDIFFSKVDRIFKDPNNSFSMLISELKKIQQKAKIIIEKQWRNSYNGFFVYKILVELFSDFFETLIKSDFKNGNLTDIDEIRNSFSDALLEYKNSLEWIKSKCLQPYYLPYNDCMVKVKEKNIFLDSTYILPINFEKKQEKISKFEDILQKSFLFITRMQHEYNLDEMKKTIRTIEDEHKTNIENTKTGLKDELEKTKGLVTKMNATFIELIGIFAAIITFVLGSISIYPKLNDLKAVVLFMIAFALSLMLFVMGLQYVVSNFKNKDEDKLNTDKPKRMRINEFINNYLPHLFLSILVAIIIYFFVTIKDTKIDTGKENEIRIEDNLIKTSTNESGVFRSEKIVNEKDSTLKVVK